MIRSIHDKKGVSEIVSYVLLISITFAIAGIVYSWLIFYVTPGKETKCEEGISLTIRSYSYNCNTKALNLSLQNRGLFDIDGYLIRVTNQSNTDIGIYTLNKTGANISVGVTYLDYYSNSSILNDSKKNLGGIIKFLEVQPFVYQNGSVPIYCENVAKQVIVCA